MTLQDWGSIGELVGGVAVIITPWNAPLMLATWRIGPALASGDTVIATAMMALAMDRRERRALVRMGKDPRNGRWPLVSQIPPTTPSARHLPK